MKSTRYSEEQIIRIIRSPLAVPRIILMASSISLSYPARARPPRPSTSKGKRHPWPKNCLSNPNHSKE